MSADDSGGSTPSSCWNGRKAFPISKTEVSWGRGRSHCRSRTRGADSLTSSEAGVKRMRGGAERQRVRAPPPGRRARPCRSPAARLPGPETAKQGRSAPSGSTLKLHTKAPHKSRHTKAPQKLHTNAAMERRFTAGNAVNAPGRAQTVVRVEPGPRRHALVVVLQHPVEPLTRPG